MTRSKRVLAAYGAGGFGREVLELGALINAGESEKEKWEKFIFIDDADDAAASVDGYPVFRYDEAKREFGDDLDVIIAVGEPHVRKILFDKVKADGISLPVLINPDSFVSQRAEIGEGSVIRYGSSIFTGVRIGSNVCVNPHANVGHDSVIGDGCMISAFVNIGGAVKIGEYSYIGMNAAIRELVSVGGHSVVSMGSIVTADVPEHALAMGNPPRLMKINDSFRVFKHAKKPGENEN